MRYRAALKEARCARVLSTTPLVRCANQAAPPIPGGGVADILEQRIHVHDEIIEVPTGFATLLLRRCHAAVNRSSRLDRNLVLPFANTRDTARVKARVRRHDQSRATCAR